MRKIIFVMFCPLFLFSCKKEAPKSTLEKIMGNYTVTKTFTYKDLRIVDSVKTQDTFYTVTTVEVPTEIRKATVPQEAFIYGNEIYNIGDGIWRGNALAYGFPARNLDTASDGLFSHLHFYVDEGRFVREYGRYSKEDSPGYYREVIYVTKWEGVKN